MKYIFKAYSRQITSTDTIRYCGIFIYDETTKEWVARGIRGGYSLAREQCKILFDNNGNIKSDAIRNLTKVKMFKDGFKYQTSDSQLREWVK